MIVRRAGVLRVHVSMMAVGGALSFGCGSSSTPNPGNDAATTNAASCPASYAEAETTGTCETKGEQCYYATGNCICSIITGGPDAGRNPDAAPPTTRWGCIALAPGCPTFPPAVGTSCSPSSTPCTVDCEKVCEAGECGPLMTTCSYGECTDVARVCIDGMWQSTGNIECPL
jgi:hypothetical protein